MTSSVTRAARSVADLTAGVILASVEIAAPPERVWRALTDPTEIIRWWGSGDTYRQDEWTGDLRVGGRWRSRGRSADGRPFSVGGEFLEVDPPRHLVQTWTPDWEQGLVTTLTFRLEPIPGGTRVTVRHEGFGDHRAAAGDHGRGWERVLGWLRDHVAPPEGVEHRQAWWAKYLNPFRLASYLLLLFCLGHTRGAVLATPSFGAPGDGVLAMMKSVHFRCMTSDCTWYGFYFGFGLLVSIFLLLSAALTWYLGGLSRRAQRALTPLTWMLFVSQGAGAVIAWTDFFLPPQVLSTVIAGLLGLEVVRQVGSEPAELRLG